MNRKGHIASVLIALAFAMALFVQESAQENGEYDPWADLNLDGKVDVNDLMYLAWSYGTQGTPERIVTTDMIADGAVTSAKIQSGVIPPQSLLHSYSLDLPPTDVYGGGSANIGGPLNITTDQSKLLMILSGTSTMWDTTAGMAGPGVRYYLQLDGDNIASLREQEDANHVHLGYQQAVFVVMPVIMTRLVSVSPGEHSIQVSMWSFIAGDTYVQFGEGQLIVLELAV